jgi:hypothetical protein
MGTGRKVDGLWTMPKGEYEQSVADLERAIVERGGNPRELFDRLRTDKPYLASVADFMVKGGVPVFTDVRIARLIMGNGLFGIEDWQTLYGVKFTKKQLREAGKFPWGEEVMNGPCPFNPEKQVKDTHFAFLGVTGINGEPLTVQKWTKLHPATGQPKFYFADNPWYEGQPYTDETTLEFRWHLLLKEIVPGSTEKTPEQQAAMLPPEYEVPSTIAEVTKDILAFRKMNVILNGGRWAACKERTIKTGKVDGNLVSCVGYFVGRGLNVNNWGGDDVGYVGVGASRKFK